MGRSMKSTVRHIPGAYVDLKGVISLLGEPAETVEETGAEEEPAEDSSHPLQIAFGIDDVVLSRASFDKLVEGISLVAEALQEARNAVE